MTEQLSKLRPLWKRSSALSDFATTIAAAIVVVVTVLDLIGVLDVGWFQTNLAKITLLLVAVVVISDVVERNYLNTRLKADLLEEIRGVQTSINSGVIGFYPDRKELEPFSKMIQNVKHELFIVGIELNYIVFQELSLLGIKAANGVKIKLLMLDPGTEVEPNVIVSALSETLGIPALQRMISDNIERVKLWKRSLPANVQNRIELKVSNTVPTHILTFIDSEKLTGFMHVELLPPGCDPGDRPSVDISAEKGGLLFQRYVREYKRVWDKSTMIH